MSEPKNDDKPQWIVSLRHEKCPDCERIKRKHKLRMRFYVWYLVEIVKDHRYK